MIKNRTDGERILANDLRMRVFNLHEITFGHVLDQCMRIWNLILPKRRAADPTNPLRLSLDLASTDAGASYFLGDAEGNVFLNHAAV